MKSFISLGILMISGMVWSQSMPAFEVINASIQYHDPNMKWASLKGEFKVVSERDTTRLILANNISKVEWNELLKDSRTITGGYIGDSCYVHIDGRSVKPEGEIDNFLLDCTQIKGRSNYWLYMFGLPMKLKDEQAIVAQKSELVDFLGNKYWRIRVDYNGSAAGEYWQFYFAPETFRFAIAQYFHPALGDDSEYIVYDTPIDLHGMVLPSKHSWYMYNEREFIGSETLTIKR